jgi:transcription antitermination factor NusG
MPLFNGYVFVRPTAIQRDKVLQIPGVVMFLRYNGDDALIPVGQLNLIKELIEFGYTVSEYSNKDVLETGDVAEILGGPLKGHEAEILKIGDDAFILVSIEAMNQSVMVKLPKEILKLRKKKAKEEIKPLW